MNTQLVNYLVGVINHLSLEEQSLLRSKLNQKINVSKMKNYQDLLQLRAEIFTRRQGKPLTINPDDLLQELREERDLHLMSVGLAQFNNTNNN